MKRMKTTLFLAIGLLPFLWATQGGAAPAAYTDYDDFMAALPGTASVLDFDDMMFNETIWNGRTVEGITFNYDYSSNIRLETVYSHPSYSMPTTSYPFVLGTNNFWMNNMITQHLSLSSEPVNALGMYFITNWGIPPDLYINSNYYRANWSDRVELGSGFGAYFIGMIDDQNSFTEASISWMGDPFAVDDIITARAEVPSVPVPSALLLLASGLLGLSGFRRKIQT